jgi:tetratricopeptide (TPR) repeat protein
MNLINTSLRSDGESATDVPCASSDRELLALGIRAEELGALERAADYFLRAARSNDSAIAAEASARLADVYRSSGEWPAATDAAHRAQELARSAGLDNIVAHATIAEANVLMCAGTFDEANALFERAMELTVDPRLRGMAMQNIGSILAQQGRLRAAQRAFAESLGYFQHAGYRRGEAIALNNCGRAALDAGDVTLATDLLKQARAAARELEMAELTALVKLNQSEAALRARDTDRALELVAQSLGFFAGCGNTWREIECLRLIGEINERQGDLSEARQCFQRALEMAKALAAKMVIRTIEERLVRVGGRPPTPR